MFFTLGIKYNFLIFSRFPLGDGPDTDDMDLMIHYPENDHMHALSTAGERRAVQLPLWAEVGGGQGTSSSTANSHVTPVHPLLMARQAGTSDLGNAASGAGTGGAGGLARAGSRSLQRQRGSGIRIHLNTRGTANPSAPAILQNFLGNPQELVSKTT